VLWQTIEVNIEALEERDAESVGLGRYAEVGRLLGGDSVSATDDVAARAALVESLRDWATELNVPGLSAFEMRPEDVATVVADSAGSSMRTNPIVLNDAELTKILTSAL
jgi:alcohol dehydrogenase class IV